MAQFDIVQCRVSSRKPCWALSFRLFFLRPLNDTARLFKDESSDGMNRRDISALASPTNKSNKSVVFEDPCTQIARFSKLLPSAHMTTYSVVG